MKKIPTFVQSFRNLIENNCVYVDKTEIIYEMISNEGFYFLSRPRRFGKTLLVETLKALFQGEKELFQGCYIATTDYSWEKYPIIHFDFGQLDAKDSVHLERNLKQKLLKTARFYGKIPETSMLNTDSAVTAKEMLVEVVEALAQDNKVVVLIDEYDKPLTDNLQKMQVAEANRDLLQLFFGTLKSLHEHLRYVFITGVSKISQLSLFSGLNNVIDLTMEPFYATILGYTEKEIRHFFDEYLDKIIKKPKNLGGQLTKDSLIEAMRQWYNGYRFSPEEITVYNPHSCMGFLGTGNFANYWFRTGTPTVLVKAVKETPFEFLALSGSKVSQDELTDSCDLDHIELNVFLWQTGYLTIQKYDSDEDVYYLDFPNREVRRAFFTFLIRKFAHFQSAVISSNAIECRGELENKQLLEFFARINTFFAKVPSNLFQGFQEGGYHAFFLLLLEAMEIRVHPEDSTNLGRVDLSIEMPNVIYVFELKVDQKPQKALDQIQEKQYLMKYSRCGKEVVAVGVSFSSTQRNIASWKAVFYNSQGVKERELGSEDETGLSWKGS